MRRKAAYFKALGTEADLLGFNLWRASNIWKRKANATLKPLNLTPGQVMLLSSVGWHTITEVKATQLSVSKHVGLNTMMVSDLVKTLENKNLIVRASNDSDKRSFVLELTKPGEQKLIQAIEQLQNFESIMFSLDEVEKSVLSKSLLELVGKGGKK